MGLDCTAYEVVTLLPEHPVDDSCWEREHDFVPHVHVSKREYDAFPQSSRGLENDRCYEVSGESIGFRAGSYGGYSEWRDQLARLGMGTTAESVWADLGGYADAPFFELVNFSDCEGSIGPGACADLAEDFMVMRGEILETCLEAGCEDEDIAWFKQQYDIWASAFALAANTGLVQFH